ncbi:hypothetical protein F1559_004436 [Cyanidiococcus yangmingshanensis]|uniref:Sm domain-containing protein n=1 Tax=Cyanidiococcus yangmingshanensis TaxID=2690220 RepID=A0A7J7IQE1_9RHOD|nr:hypothetical protein F1559_004436 [Cyanidiococcus yangmingshanensis]
MEPNIRSDRSGGTKRTDRTRKDKRQGRSAGKGTTGGRSAERRSGPSGRRELPRERRSNRANGTWQATALEVSPWAGHWVQVTLAGGRCIVGKLVGWDALANLVLDDAVERFRGATDSAGEVVTNGLPSFGAQFREVSDVYTSALEARRTRPANEDKSLLMTLSFREPTSGSWQRQLGRVVLRGPSVATLGPLEEPLKPERDNAPTNTRVRAKNR